MPDETGNAQTDRADPTQAYGLARWLNNQPLFSALDTPKAIYEAPTKGQMNVDSTPKIMPWLESVPREPGDNSFVDDPSEVDYGSVSAPGDLGLGYSDLGKIGSRVGSVAGMLGNFTGGGMLGAALGTGIGQTAANQSLAAKGLPTMGISDYFGNFLNVSVPFAESIFGIRNMNDRILDNMDLGGYFDAWTAADWEAGQRARDSGVLDGPGYDPSHHGVSFENSDDDNDFGGPSHDGVGFENSDDDNDFGW